MLEFIISNYIIFVVIAIILLLGLFGYMMDRKKYEEYRDEIINQDKIYEALDAAPETISSVSAPISMAEEVVTPGPVVVQTPVQTVQTVQTIQTEQATTTPVAPVSMPEQAPVSSAPQVVEENSQALNSDIQN